MPKIYTKVGDQGQTALVGGQKVFKSDYRIEAYGTVDELNSVLGLVCVELLKLRDFGFAQLLEDIQKIQHWLFDLGSLLATLPDDRAKFKLPPLTKEQIQFLEQKIDAATLQLKPLKTFILPGGTELAARFHLARTVSRRAERLLMVAQKEQNEKNYLPEHCIPLVNRLSDYFFTMARLANHLQGVEDIPWKKSAE